MLNLVFNLYSCVCEREIGLIVTYFICRNSLSLCMIPLLAPSPQSAHMYCINEGLIVTNKSLIVGFFRSNLEV